MRVCCGLALCGLSAFVCCPCVAFRPFCVRCAVCCASFMVKGCKRCTACLYAFTLCDAVLYLYRAVSIRLSQGNTGLHTGYYRADTGLKSCSKMNRSKRLFSVKNGLKPTLFHALKSDGLRAFLRRFQKKTALEYFIYPCSRLRASQMH